MSRLFSRVRIPDQEATSQEDIFNAGLDLLFPDDAQVSHGDPGSHIIYTSPRFGDIQLKLANPVGEDERLLFAHYLWNSSITLADFVSQAVAAPGDWNVTGLEVLELGAGAGLAGLTSVLAGAKRTAITDFPSPKILATLKHNVDVNIPTELRVRAVVQGHEWGMTSDPFSLSHAGDFDRIICADCLWMDGEHDSLARSMQHFLSPSISARIWVTAGFHTGREKVVAFFDTMDRKDFELDRAWEQNVMGHQRPWDPIREDTGGKGKWLVIAMLKRR